MLLRSLQLSVSLLAALVVVLPFAISVTTKQVTCLPPNINTTYTFALAKSLAKEMTRSINDTFTFARNLTPPADRSIAYDSIEVATNLSIPREERIQRLGQIMAKKRNSSITLDIEFMATVNINRGEQWTRDFLLLDLDPVTLFKQVFAVPWENVHHWDSTRDNKKYLLVLAAIHAYLCKEH